MANVEDVKRKIKKLLALSTSPYEGEARAALLKAKELMAKHKLSNMDLEDPKKQEMVHKACDSIKWTTDSGEVWIANLCTVIADNYCCVTAWYTPGRTRTHILEITGMQEDVDLCADVIEYAVGFVRGAIKHMQRRNRITDPRTVASSYATGFISGLQMAYEDQKEEHPEWGLVVVETEDLKAYKDSLGSKSVKTRRTGFDPLSHTAGFNDGREFNASKVIQ